MSEGLDGEGRARVVPRRALEEEEEEEEKEGVSNQLDCLVASFVFSIPPVREAVNGVVERSEVGFVAGLSDVTVITPVLRRRFTR